MAHQIAVFAENKPGRIERVTRVLMDAGINIRAITVSRSEGFGMIKLLVDEPARAYEEMTAEGMSASQEEILAIRMDDQPGGLHRIAELFTRRGINMENAYGFVIRSGEKAVLVVEVEKIPEALSVLQEEGIEVLRDDEIYSL